MNTADPHTADPHTADPHTADPHTADPYAADRHPADRLHRSRDHRMLAGVADGLADYFDVDTTLVRVGFVALALFGGVGVPLYLAGWLLIPDEGSDRSVAEDLLGRERTA